MNPAEQYLANRIGQDAIVTAGLLVELEQKKQQIAALQEALAKEIAKREEAKTPVVDSAPKIG